MNANHVLHVLLFGFCLIPAVNASAQVAGSTTGESAMVGTTDVAMGWSAKKKVLGKTVYNDEQGKVGTIEDIIIARDGTGSYIVVSAGGFGGVSKHNVAVPAGSLVERDKKFVLPGATKSEIKAATKFEFEK